MWHFACFYVRAHPYLLCCLRHHVLFCQNFTILQLTEITSTPIWNRATSPHCSCQRARALHWVSRLPSKSYITETFSEPIITTTISGQSLIGTETVRFPLTHNSRHGKSQCGRHQEGLQPLYKVMIHEASSCSANGLQYWLAEATFRSILREFLSWIHKVKRCQRPSPALLLRVIRIDQQDYLRQQS